MRRRTLAPLLALTLLALVPTAAGAAPASDVPKGQACADVSSGDGYYRNEAWTGGSVTTETVFQNIQLAAPSCLYKNGKPATYTIEVYASDATSEPPTQGALLDSRTVSGDGVNDVLTFVFELGSTPDAVCAVATTTIGGKVVDRAPDTGCERFILNATDSGGRGSYK